MFRFNGYFKSPFMDDDSGSTGMAANDGEVAELQQDNPDNTGDVDNVEPAQSTEPTEPQEPQEDITQTQAFSKRLNEMTQKAIDAEYDRLYGAEYGIHSKAEYDAYVARQQAIEQGKDPEIVDLQNDLNLTKSELQELKFEKALISQRENLSNDPKYGDVFKAWEGELKQRMEQYDQMYYNGQLNQRVDLDTAFTLMWREKGPEEITRLKQKLDIEKANKESAARSTGSVKGQGKVDNQFFTIDQVKAMTQQEILANYNAIQESKKSW